MKSEDMSCGGGGGGGGGDGEDVIEEEAVSLRLRTRGIILLLRWLLW